MQNDPTAHQSQPINPQPVESPPPPSAPAPAEEPPAGDQGAPETPHRDGAGEDAGAAYVVRDGNRVRQ